MRGQKVMIAADLVQRYGMPAKRINEQVKRTAARFPPDFIFMLTQLEKDEVVANCDHLGTLKFSNSLPYAFTENGAIQAANVRPSLQAIRMGVRAFVRLREMIVPNRELALGPDGLEHKTELMPLKRHTTTDFLLTGAATDAQPINNVRLPDRFRALAQCELEEQEAVTRLIDAVVVKHRVESAMQPVGKTRGHAKGVV